MPIYPILDPLELGDIRDHRDLLPKDVQDQLGKADRVIHIVDPEISESTEEPSALSELLRLTGSKRIEEVGDFGGPVASLAASHNVDVDALRKFEVVHGRDAIEISRKLSRHFPKLLRTTLLTLAKTQGLVNETYTHNTPYRQEEAGRIMLLDRNADDPIALKFSQKLGWGWPFYGSIDATPSFISAIAQYTIQHDNDFLSTNFITRHGDERRIQDAFDLSVDWLIGRLEQSSFGLLEFKNTAEVGGMDSQAWKDSAFAYVHKDGSRANHRDGIASIEVQTLAYDALLDASDISRLQGFEDQAEAFESRAADLRKRIFEMYWVKGARRGSYFALAIDHDPVDGSPRPLEVRTSNMGHMLNSRIFDDKSMQSKKMVESIIKQLFSPELLNYSGIRTLASDEKGYRHGGYHTGSVWLWDTSFIADGLDRQGYKHLAWELRTRIWQTAEETKIFPEFVRGDSIHSVKMNTKEIYVWNEEYEVLHLFEQPPQEVQGWTVSAVLAAKYAYAEYKINKHRIPYKSLESAILKSL